MLESPWYAASHSAPRTIMKQISLVVTLFFGILTITLVAKQSFAQTSCTQVFGGGKPCITSKKIAIAKQVRNPDTNAFVSSLPTTGPYYAADQTITFRITIENKTNSKLTKITITDSLPKYFMYSKGEGKFDKQKNALTINVESLAPKEKKTYDISGKIASSNDISKLTSGMNCFINQATAVTGKETAQTNTQYCLEIPIETASTISQLPSQTSKGTVVYPPQKTAKSPDTGAEALGLMALLPMAYTGFLMRRKFR